MRFVQIFLASILLFLHVNAKAFDKVVNVYAWTGEIPETVIRLFEKETGIRVHFSTYENNEIMYTKIKAVPHHDYDVIMPSGYFVPRMQSQGLLAPLDKNKLPNRKHLDALFQHPAYDASESVSVPFIWGVTGIFYNDRYYHASDVESFSSLFQKKFANQLLLLDDSRELFSMALIAKGYRANDDQAAHITAAYQKLLTLLPNIKVFSTETVVSMMIDEDVRVGMSWNGDAYKASLENPHIHFVFPKDGFVIWVDNFAIPKTAPHINEAHTFINFMLRPDVAKMVAMETRFPVTNKTTRALLPKEVRENPILYPEDSVLKRGQFQTNLDETVLSLYERYWTELKIR